MKYHRDVYLPPELKAEVERRNFSWLSYTGHAIQAAREDGLRPHQLPFSVVLSEWELIHVETNDRGRVDGVLLRRPLVGTSRDLVLAISVPDGRVKTVWTNHRRDSHRTLDRSKYVQKPLNYP